MKAAAAKKVSNENNGNGTGRHRSFATKARGEASMIGPPCLGGIPAAPGQFNHIIRLLPTFSGFRVSAMGPAD